MATVYEHIFPNNKRYIGLTIQSVSSRWQNGEGYKKQPVYDAILFYGWDAIKHNIIAEDLTITESQNLEKKLIHDYDTINNGYNVSIGGGAGGKPWVEILYNGEVYTAEELAKLSGVEGLTAHDITTRVNHHKWSIERALTQPKKKKDKKYEYNGNVYGLSELYEIRKNKDITYRQIATRLNRHNWDVERAITQSNMVKEQPFGVGEKRFFYNEQYYNSYELWCLRKEKSLSQFVITNRISHHNWSVEDAISIPAKSRNIVLYYEGKEYNTKSLAEICVDKSMRYHDVTGRLRMGWSIWEIVHIPKGAGRKRFYKNINK